MKTTVEHNHVWIPGLKNTARNDQNEEQVMEEALRWRVNEPCSDAWMQPIELTHMVCVVQ